MLQPVVTFEGSIGRVQMNSEAEAIYRRVVVEYPDFPFGHYYLALCLREKADTDWRTHAEMALALFEETTQIVGHNPQHDDGLRRLRKLLGKRQ
jgi:hypothetical protein